MCPNLWSRAPGDICQGGHLQEKAAGTPLPGDHAQRKRGRRVQLHVHAEQALPGGLLSASVFASTLVPGPLTPSALYAQIPNTYESHLSDDPDITLRNLEPVTPMSTAFPEVKTPQCLHITPGMMGSPNR